MRLPQQTKIYLIGLIGFLFFFSCEAPRENPLDPENPDNNFSTISGVVRTVKVPNQPIEGVQVFWEKEKILVQTDADGTFRIEGISPESGMLFFEKEGYSRDSLEVIWNDTRFVTITKQLNSTPKFLTGSMISIVENRFDDIQVYSILVRTFITDDEGDVDSVFIQNSQIDVNTPLSNVTPVFFQHEFQIDQLNLTSIDDAIGREFDVVAKDALGKEFVINQISVKRIIKDNIVNNTPSNNEIIPSDSLEFNWTRFTPGYSFNYWLQIYTNTVDPDLVWERNNISSDDIMLDIESTLSPGDYFWVLWVVDNFGNRARSRPLTFRIR